MRPRFAPLLLTGFFIGFLLFGAIFMIAADRTNTVSETENRALAPFPEWAQAALWSGEYFRELENYIADHFAFRDVLVRAGKALSSWQGLAGEEGTYIVAAGNINNTGEKQEEFTAQAAPTDYALAVERNAEPELVADQKRISSEANSIQSADLSKPLPASEGEKTAERLPEPEETGRVIGKVLIAGNRAMYLFSHNPAAGTVYADTINDFRARATDRLGNELEVSVLVAPTAIQFIRSEKLRKLSDSQQEAIEAVCDQLAEQTICVNSVSELQSQADHYLYFRTDHHWTATGAYYAYSAWMHAKGATPIPLSDYETETVSGFLGSLYSSTLNKNLEADPDTIVLYKPNVDHEYAVYYSGPLKMNLLDMNHADKQNKYRIFLSGDRPWGKITTDTENDRRLAVIKDSFGNAFVPFLLPHYQEIFVIDPRQFDQSLIDFMEKHQINEVLFLNNAEVTTHAGFTDLIRKLVRD